MQGAPIAIDLAAQFSAIDGWELQSQPFHGANVEEMQVGLTILKAAGYKVFLSLGYESATLLMLREATALGMIRYYHAFYYPLSICTWFR